MNARVYDRARGVCFEEKQFRDKQADFLYNTAAGRALLRLFVASKAFSRLSALPGKRKKSASKIGPFIETYGIDMSDYGDTAYKTFYDFFIRKPLPGKRPFPQEAGVLGAVADAKLTVYPVGPDLAVTIKNQPYTVAGLLDNAALARGFENGLCLVFRLTVDDCHRYCFFDSGRVTGSSAAGGKLHTVGPVSAQRHRVYTENYRCITTLATDHFGEAAMIEIGAMLVGKIHNHPVGHFQRGDEKGYFAPGGSSIAVLLKAGAAVIDGDIARYSAQGVETKVRMGERIGAAPC